MEPSKMMTVGDIAARLAEATKQDEGAIARQLRGWIQTGALKPTTTQARGTSGAIVAALFDEAGLCRARLLMALVASSTVRTEANGAENDDRFIPRILGQADSNRTELYTNGVHRNYNLICAIEGSRAGENWVLEVVIVRDFLEKRTTPTAHWLCNGQRDELVTVDPMRLDVGVIGGEIEAAIQIPFSKLIRPLLAS